MFIDFLILPTDNISTKISIFDIVTHNSRTARDIKLQNKIGSLELFEERDC
jgi:hypothetical protein